jgi:hypothetical protein
VKGAGWSTHLILRKKDCVSASDDVALQCSAHRDCGTGTDAIGRSESTARSHIENGDKINWMVVSNWWALHSIRMGTRCPNEMHNLPFTGSLLATHQLHKLPGG